MKYAVISDIHGNLPALEAVLADVRQREITHCLFAGDYCISGPWPDECIAVLRAIPGKTVIRGNEENYLENLIGRDPSQWTDGQMQISYWSYRNISRSNLDYVLALPHTADLICNSVPIHMAHASDAFLASCICPNSIGIVEQYAGVDVTHDMLRHDILSGLEQDHAFQKKVSSLADGVYIFGHSHVQWHYQTRDRRVCLINPGSCGLPLDGIRDSIPYTILEIADNGRISVEEKRIPFDKAAYIRTLTQTGQFREATVWTQVIMKELSKAREHIYYFLTFADRYAKRIGDDRRPFAADTWEQAYEAWNRSLEE